MFNINMTEQTSNLSLVIDSIKLQTDGMTEKDGILSVPAVIARQMIYQYDDVKAIKPFEELEAAAKFADGIPITLEHPPAGIVTDRTEVLGFLRNPIAENDELKAILEISDKTLLGDIKAGTYTDVSPGFFCALDHTAGTLKGVKYDAVQRNIFLNHVAVCKIGKCSLEDGCGFHVDAKKTDPPPTTPTDATLVKITAERDALKANLESIVRTEKDALIKELTAMQDTKKKEDLEKLKLDELRKELDMVNELRTDRLTVGKNPSGDSRTAVDEAYANIGR